MSAGTAPENAVVWWWVSWGGAEPYVIDEEELVEQVAAAELDDSALVWTDGLADWSPVARLPELLRQRPAPSTPKLMAVAGSVFGSVPRAVTPWEPPPMPAWELAVSDADPFEVAGESARSPAADAPSAAEPRASDTPTDGEAAVPARPPAAEDAATGGHGAPHRGPDVDEGTPRARPEGGTMARFGKVLGELVESERSYVRSLELLLRSYRPALEPVAPTLLGAVFDGLAPLLLLAEELQGKLSGLHAACHIPLAHAESPPLGAGSHDDTWPAEALAETFAPSHLPLAEHPLLVYRQHINRYDHAAPPHPIPSHPIRSHAIPSHPIPSAGTTTPPSRSPSSCRSRPSRRACVASLPSSARRTPCTTCSSPPCRGCLGTCCS